MLTKSSTASSGRTPADPPIGEGIQPLGFVAVVSREWLVDAISGNIEAYFGAGPAAILGRPLSDLLGAEAVHGLRNQVALLREPDAVARLFACLVGDAGKRFDFTLRLDRARTLIEGQAAGKVQHGDTIATIRALIGRLEAQSALGPMLDIAVRQIRALTGFDRVALYRDQGDGSATVFAQTARSLPEVKAACDEIAYSSLWAAPAMVANCDSEAVAMVPASPLTGATLCAPSSADRECMRDAGTKARLRLSLLVNGASWGTIVCDHPAPRAPGADLQSSIGLYAQMLGLLVEIRQLKDG